MSGTQTAPSLPKDLILENVTELCVSRGLPNGELHDSQACRAAHRQCWAIKPSPHGACAHGASMFKKTGMALMGVTQLGVVL